MEQVPVKWMAHITGGGLIENVPRILPKHLDAVIDISTWPVRTIFQSIMKLGNIEQPEMFNVFNMGIGMVLIVGHEHFRSALALFANLGYRAFHIGEVLEGTGGICLTC